MITKEELAALLDERRLHLAAAEGIEADLVNLLSVLRESGIEEKVAERKRRSDAGVPRGPRA